MSELYEEHPSLFKKGRKLAQGKGIYDMMAVSKKRGYKPSNTILERGDFGYEDLSSDLFDVDWKIFERQRIQHGKSASSIHGHDITGFNRPKFGMERTSSIGASFYHETAIAKDIANVRKKRG